MSFGKLLNILNLPNFGFAKPPIYWIMLIGKLLNHLYSGQYFGEIALRHKKHSNATVRAGLSQVELLVMNQEMFDELRRAFLSRKLDEFMPGLRRRARDSSLLNQLDL